MKLGLNVIITSGVSSKLSILYKPKKLHGKLPPHELAIIFTIGTWRKISTELTPLHHASIHVVMFQHPLYIEPLKSL